MSQRHIPGIEVDHPTRGKEQITPACAVCAKGTAVVGGYEDVVGEGGVLG